MSSFDAAMALSQDQLNKMLAIIYQKVFPQVFSGSKTVNQEGIEYVEWVISAAPQFNLSASSDGSTLELDFIDVGVRLDPVNNGEPIIYQLTNVKAMCTMQVSGNTISFVPHIAACDPISDKLQQDFAQLVFLPAVQSALEALMTGFTLPSLTFAGTNLSAPSATIVDSHIVIAVNLAAKGTPSPAPDGSWTSSGFSLLLSPDLMQAGVISQQLSYNHSASAGSKLGGYDWSYSLNLNNPTITNNGSNFNLAFSFSCPINATADVTYTSVGVPFGSSTSPAPTAVCSLVVNNGALQLVTQSIPPYTINIAPSGSVPSQVADWMVRGISITIVNSLTPVINQYLGNLQLGSIAIPTFTEHVAGITIVMAPTDLVQSSVNGYTAFGGTVSAE